MKYFKSYAVAPEPDLPAVVGRTRGIEPGSVLLHNHPGIEINLLLEGTCEYLIGGTNYTCFPGDLIVIGEGEVHRAWNADAAVFLVVLFRAEVLVPDMSPGYEQKFLAPFWAVGRGRKHRISPGVPGYERLVADLMSVEDEARRRDNSYRLLIRTHLLDFAAILTRTFGIPDDSPLLDRGQRSRRFSALRDHLEEHYAERILVADMAGLVNMSVTNFTRTFKAVFGKTPLEYLLQVRIRHAAQLMLSGDRKIIDIANDCGFPSISHFITCFRRITGVAPHIYRKQQTGG